MKTFVRRPEITVTDAVGWRGRLSTISDDSEEDAVVMNLQREAALLPCGRIDHQQPEASRVSLPSPPRRAKASTPDPRPPPPNLPKRTLFTEMPERITFPASGSDRWSSTGRG
jgi:hypothetical protein